jgi:catechol 2,3-dioxygenase-like lactoylglutathione lyase family enzyme
MESVIATLLREFETGRLSRRQLVQTLALVATGSPVASALAQSAAATPKPASAGTPWKTVWLDHISFQVADYKRSVDFYTDLMGWKVLNDTGTQATIDINGIGGIIIRNRRQPGGGPPNGAPNGAQNGAPNASAPNAVTPNGSTNGSTNGAPNGMPNGGQPGNRPPVTAVIDHISWGIAPWDTETVRGELLKRGLTPREDTGNRGTMETSPFKSFHVKDPDGWDLQISNQTKENHDLG